MTNLWYELNLILAWAQQGGGGNGGANGGADGAGGAGGTGGPEQAPTLFDTLWSMAPFLIIIVFFFWWMSRSQKKKQQRREQMLSEIKAKDRVVTVGGIHGRVVSVQDDTFVIRVDDEKDIKVTVDRNGVHRKEGEEEPA